MQKSPLPIYYYAFCIIYCLIFCTFALRKQPIFNL